MSERGDYIAGLRAFADWLEEHPDARTPQVQALNMYVATNYAVEAFATQHGLTVTYDDEGNASTDLTFGGLIYHVYGYIDFEAHVQRSSETRAREWASEHGMQIVPAEDDTDPGGDAA